MYDKIHHKLKKKKKEIQRIIRDYYEQLYDNRMENLEKWTFLERCKSQNWTRKK